MRILPTLFFFLLSLTALFSEAQSDLTQYFDGADTSASNSIIIDRDTTPPTVWQVGPPQKSIFDSATSQPNVIVTDTVSPYPSDTNASFEFGIGPSFLNTTYILSLQWTQRLDMEKDRDGGSVQFSLDSGTTWHNAFNHDSVYSFYGFMAENKDTLYNGDFAFSGVDSTWRDIWLCIDSATYYTDSIAFRFKFHSDTGLNSNREGWMMDNFIASSTYIHTVKEQKVTGNKFIIHPNPTQGKVRITAESGDGEKSLEQAWLMDVNGRIVERYSELSGKSEELDIGDLPKGTYFLKVKSSSSSTETFKLILEGH